MIDTIISLLDRLQSEGNSDSYVIFSIQEQPDYFIQIAPEQDETPPLFYAEAASNEHIEPPYQLSSEQIQKLLDIGWQAPKPGYLNFYGYFKDDKELIAKVILQTFVEVYQLNEQQNIEIDLLLDKSE